MAAIAESRPLKVLLLDDNRLGSRGARALSRVLCAGSELKVLDLSKNGVGSNGANELAQAAMEVGRKHSRSYSVWATI